MFEDTRQTTFCAASTTESRRRSLWRRRESVTVSTLKSRRRIRRYTGDRCQEGSSRRLSRPSKRGGAVGLVVVAGVVALAQ
jgi:hypothetical protein